MAGFVSRYEYQLDEKGRVSLPAEYRRKADSPRFVLLQWEPTHLTLFPDTAWEGVKERLLALRRSQRELASVLRSVTSNAVEVEPDKQGRILVPARLREGAGLVGSVLVVGALDRIELWNPETFDAEHPAEPAAEAPVADLVHGIFG